MLLVHLMFLWRMHCNISRVEIKLNIYTKVLHNTVSIIGLEPLEHSSDQTKPQCGTRPGGFETNYRYCTLEMRCFDLNYLDHFNITPHLSYHTSLWSLISVPRLDRRLYNHKVVVWWGPIFKDAQRSLYPQTWGRSRGVESAEVISTSIWVYPIMAFPYGPINAMAESI